MLRSVLPIACRHKTKVLKSLHLISQVNQIGTVTESIQAALDSKAAGWGVMVSHRSGETEDNFIADLSVGLASGQVLYFTSTAAFFCLLPYI